MNKMDWKEKKLGSFFKLHELERNGISLGRIKTGSFNPMGHPN
jgi:hypothetical protein